MTDLALNAYVRSFGELHVERMIVDNSAAQEIFVGAPMFIDVSEDTSYPRIFDSGISLGFLP